jgi:hypothetical protein
MVRIPDERLRVSCIILEMGGDCQDFVKLNEFPVQRNMHTASGIPRKFFHGIYLVYSFSLDTPGYTWYIPRICFPDKILFSSK